jgi:hypothetical protein
MRNMVNPAFLLGDRNDRLYATLALLETVIPVEDKTHLPIRSKLPQNLGQEDQSNVKNASPLPPLLRA